jgi:hypothetical protein
MTKDINIANDRFCCFMLDVSVNGLLQVATANSECAHNAKIIPAPVLPPWGVHPMAMGKFPWLFYYA